MAEEDIVHLLETIVKSQELVMNLVKSFNVKIDKLVNLHTKEMAKEIVETLKAEEGETSVNNVDVAKPGKVSSALTDSTPSEVVLMDLKEVTQIAHTEKAILVTKKGLQKWIPKSTIREGTDYEEGTYFKELALTEAGEKWVHKKGWDKLEVRKR